MSDINPIQQVLEAEKRANEEIERERTHAAQTLSEARLWARNLMTRTERRLQRAIAPFEQSSAERRNEEARALRERVAHETRQRRREMESSLDAIVDEVFRHRWPQRESVDRTS
jgi:vacuolar-type H+-ATPase subunit H